MFYLLEVCCTPITTTLSLHLAHQLLKPGAHQPACYWFLKIVSVWTSVCVCACVCVCVPLRLLITSGIMLHDMDAIRLVKQVLQLLYSMATVVGIVNGCYFGIDTRYGN